MHIGLEIGLSGLIQAGVKFILDKVNYNDNRVSNTGDRSAATNTGIHHRHHHRSHHHLLCSHRTSQGRTRQLQPPVHTTPRQHSPNKRVTAIKVNDEESVHPPVEGTTLFKNSFFNLFSIPTPSPPLPPRSHQKAASVHIGTRTGTIHTPTHSYPNPDKATFHTQ